MAKIKIARPRLLVALILLVLLLPAVLLLSRHPQKTEATWFNETWLYRKAINITNTGSADANKKVKFDIDTAALYSAGKIQIDCDDSRFTDINGAPLDYFLDSVNGACNTNSTDYYVLIPTINAGTTTIYHYYGNPSAIKGSLNAQLSQATFTQNSTTVNSEEQSPGPVAYWKFDEGTGTTSQDSTANNNDGTISGASWQTEDMCVSGKCLKFDGSNDYVSVADNSSLDITNQITMEVWFKASGTIGNKQLISKGDLNYEIGTNSGGKLAFSYKGTDYNDFRTDAGLINPNIWYHAALVYSFGTPASASFYINGNRVSASWDSGEGDESVSSNNSALQIGGKTINSNYFSGFLDDVKIYPYARSPAQIAWDYNRGKPIAHWKFDECQGGIAHDSAADPAAGGTREDGTITIGTSGTQSQLGTCAAVDAATAWYNGRNGKYNYSLNFDGTDDYTQVSDTANLRFDANTADFSLFAWIKRTITGTEYIISKEDADNDGWRLMSNSSNQIVCSEDARDVTSGSTITDTNWHLIGCTIDRDGNGQIYIDGVANGSAVSMGTDAMATTSNIRIATRSYTSANYFSGLIDDVRIYNYALTATQVKTLYNENSAIRFGPITGAP